MFMLFAAVCTVVWLIYSMNVEKPEPGAFLSMTICMLIGFHVFGPRFADRVEENLNIVPLDDALPDNNSFVWVFLDESYERFAYPAQWTIERDGFISVDGSRIIANVKAWAYMARPEYVE